MEWKKNLFDHQAEPPPEAWDNIHQQLNMEAPAHLRDQLYTLEVPPPQHNWDTINTLLQRDIPAEAPVKKLWYRKPWTIAAAAAVAAVVFGINYNRQDQSAAAAGVTTAFINPLPASPEQADLPQEVATPGTEDPVMTAMKNKDNNYLYFTTNNGEARRLSYKLKHLLPAIREKKHHKTVDAWADMLEHSPAAPASGSFLEIVDMVKNTERSKN